MKRIAIMMVAAMVVAMFAVMPVWAYEWEYSTTKLPATGVTRGQQIYRWDSEPFVTEEGETHYRCKYIWAKNLKQDTVSKKITTKYPAEKNVEDVVKTLDK